MTLRERNSFDLNGDWSWYNDFCGIKMASNFYTYHIFSTIFTENPQIKKVIELGTHTGSMAIALGLEAIRLGIEAITIEITDQTAESTKRILNKLDVQRIVMDIFGNSNQIKKLFDTPVYLLCDNGNKENEFNLFLPHLKSGSIISVHDYEVEFMPEIANNYRPLIEPFHPEQWQKHNVQLATWFVK